ncbi:MAG: hypothetical protein J7K61_02040 [Thermoplasmata archaeon]|nr:hypothetical protein [Thermoplasmata archaeon]
MKKELPIVLKYKGWIIKKDAYGYILHHVNDKKMRNAVYPGSLSSALKLLYEKILLGKMNGNYDGSLTALRKAIDETNAEFEELLKPKAIAQMRRIEEDERKTSC